MKKSRKKATKPRVKSLADPQDLSPINKEEGLLQVIIETPKGSRNKYAFDPEQRIFTLKTVLPAGMAFPYDFGFLPRTKAADGDPVDVLVLMDSPAFPGCAVNARLVGVIEGEQVDDGKKVRNDRLIAVADKNCTYTYIRKMSDLPKQFERELGEFFVNYHRLLKGSYKLLGCKGHGTAEALIKKARKAA